MRYAAFVSRSLLAGGLILFTTAEVSAQDVLEQGRVYGVTPPAWVLDRLRQDPTAFEFQRAWIHKVRRIREARRQVELALSPSYSTSSLAATGAAVTGTYYLPVVAGLYSDATARFSQPEYQRRLFGDGSGTVSLSEYYAEVSRGVFAVAGEVTEWTTLPHTASYYEPDSSDSSDRYGNAGEFIQDALLGVDGSFDFSQFDNDGPDGVPNSGDDDGYVDAVAFIYPAEPMSCGGPGIWPHRWRFEAWGLGTFYTDDAAANGGFIKVSDYIIQSGLNCFGRGIMGSGTIAHELGHALDLPDLYDTDRDDGTDSRGIGYWGLMGSGNHNEQTSPAHMSAWSKDFLGWVDVTTVVTNQSGMQLQPIQTTGSVLRVDAPNTNEYFLLSNRQRVGSDAHLQETGLLIWHIDSDVIAAKSNSNRVNADANHKGVDLEEADGLADLDFRVNRGDDGDVYPGVTANTAIDLNSNPSSLSYGGGMSGLGVRNITMAGGVVGFDIAVDELETFVWGDVNDDGVVDIDDVDMVYWHALGWDGADTTLIRRGDVDADGDVDVLDGFVTHSYLQGVGTSAFRVGVLGVGTPPPIATSNVLNASGTGPTRVVPAGRERR